MARLRLYDAIAAPAQGVEAAHPKVELVTEGDRDRFIFPFAPPKQVSGLADRYAEADRSGREPVLRNVGGALKTETFEALVAHGDHQRSVEGRLATLRKMADKGRPVRWRNFGPSSTGWFLITDLTVEDELRAHGSNEITRARVSFTLTEESDVDVKVGPVSGGKKRKQGKKGKKGGRDKAQKWPKTYKVKAGDTLAKIAGRFYDAPDEWPTIADANGIRNPRNLKVGAKLKIPRP